MLLLLSFLDRNGQRGGHGIIPLITRHFGICHKREAVPVSGQVRGKIVHFQRIVGKGWRKEEKERFS